MKIIEYYLHTLMTLPLLYAITSSMIEFRFSKKKSFCIIIYAIMMTFVMEGLLFYKGVDSISIYSYGPFTTVLPSFLCLLYLSKHRNMSFLFLYLTETVLASIVTTMSYLLAYYILGENWYVQSIIHTLLLLIQYT